MKRILFILFSFFLLSPVFTQEIISLIPPQREGGMPLMEVLDKRTTSRSFDSRELSQQQMSDLFWAAFGINRPDGKRTAPSSRNNQETDLYVLMPQGVYIYEAENHRLRRILEQDLRPLGGTQDFVADAPLTIVLVADLERMGQGQTGSLLQTAYIDAGYISQNIYLYCTSAGLATGARGLIDRQKLGEALGLKTSQAITVAHCVGYGK